MKAYQIDRGGVYAAKVNGRLVPCRVDAVSADGTYRTAYDVTNLATGRKTTFRSATKFRRPVPPGAEGLVGVELEVACRPGGTGACRRCGKPDARPRPPLAGVYCNACHDRACAKIAGDVFGAAAATTPSEPAAPPCPAAPAGTLHLVKKGDAYEATGADAWALARALGRSVVPTAGGDACGFPATSLADVIGPLAAAGHDLEIRAATEAEAEPAAVVPFGATDTLEITFTRGARFEKVVARAPGGGHAALEDFLVHDARGDLMTVRRYAACRLPGFQLLSYKPAAPAEVRP